MKRKIEKKNALDIFKSIRKPIGKPVKVFNDKPNDKFNTKKALLEYEEECDV